MSLLEADRQCSEADILAIDALFKRIAKRGRKIRLQRQSLLSDSVEGSHIEKSSSMQAIVANENGHSS